MSIVCQEQQYEILQIRNFPKQNVFFSPKLSEIVGLAKIMLGGVPLPWVPEVLQLSHHLECDNSMKKDITMKTGKVIGKVNNLKQEFRQGTILGIIKACPKAFFIFVFRKFTS